MRIKFGKINDYSKNRKLDYFKWHFAETDDIPKYIKEMCEESEYVNDSDNSGDDTYYYVVGHEGEFRFFKIRHSWYWHNFGQENSNLENEFEFSEITKEEVDKDYTIPPLV